jgi:hypothetical protein
MVQNLFVQPAGQPNGNGKFGSNSGPLLEYIEN